MNGVPKSEINVGSTAELAAKLGLSRWAVSRALNGRPGISKATAARVRAAMQEYQFEPDPLARGLRGGASGMVAVCVPRRLMDSSAIAHTGLHPLSTAAGLYSLYKRLEENGLLAVSITPDYGMAESDAIRRLVALRVDGIVLLQPGHDIGDDAATANRLIPAEIPCVAIDPERDSVFTALKCDRTQAARLVINHLHQLGHKRFGLLGMLRNSSQMRAFEAAAATLGLSWKNQFRTLDVDDLSSVPTSGETYGWALADMILRRKIAVTCLIAADDTIAAGVAVRLHQEKKSIPGDFSLIGYGNISSSAVCNVPLTTVDPQAGRLFELAADTLCAQLRTGGQVETHEILINPLFLKRASTAPPAVSG